MLFPCSAEQGIFVGKMALKNAIKIFSKLPLDKFQFSIILLVMVGHPQVSLGVAQWP